ncbi:hypothetical protein ACTQ07_07385 [Holdemanella porci]|uniref:hypothetical protein n=1 Tax=Holdemanella porci TaxID=2652276 RepID=UPI003F8E186D
MDKILSILKGLGIPFAYDHFAQGESPDPPFICYLIPSSDNFSADGVAYYKINQYNIELYTDLKDLSLERKLEEALDEASIFYNKSETWIESESLYEVLYTFEMEGENNAKEQSEV